jgi:hypothetical protein
MIMSGPAGDNPEGRANVAAFVQGLEKGGWTEGRNARIDVRWDGIDPNRAPALAKPLAR